MSTFGRSDVFAVAKTGEPGSRKSNRDGDWIICDHRLLCEPDRDDEGIIPDHEARVNCQAEVAEIPSKKLSVTTRALYELQQCCKLSRWNFLKQYRHSSS